MGLVLRAVDVSGPCRWRWLLVDESSGVLLADHRVNLDADAAETEAFGDLYRFLRWRAAPDRRVASEAELVERVGTWIGSTVLGPRIGRAIATAAPVTVRVQLPPEAEFLAFRPVELAHVEGVPLAARGDIALVYEFAVPTRVPKAGVDGRALRMLAVFSLPTAASAGALRRERYELPRSVHRVALRSRRRVELQVAQHGLSREVLADLVRSGSGWDVLHLSGHGGVGEFLLEAPDGSTDPVSTTELIELLRPARSRLKLAVVSTCQSAAASTAENLRRLGLPGPIAELEAQAAQDAASSVGVARALVTELDCAVVAMRYPVVDDFAVRFAEVLYDRMFRNVQPLDRAVSAAVAAVASAASAPYRPAISVITPAIFGASAVGLSLEPPIGRPVVDPTGQVMAGFPAEPPRFVGRAEAMGAAGAALAPASGRTAVVVHGMPGVGKTACALELACRHQRAFDVLAFWSAPTDPDEFGDALRLLAVAWEAKLADHGLAMVDKIATPARLTNFLPTLTSVLTTGNLLLVLDNLDTLLTADGQWRDLRWGPLVGALTRHRGTSRVIMASRVVPAGLDRDQVLIRSVAALSRDESLLLARQLPNLRDLLPTEPLRGEADAGDPALSCGALTLAQGHPTLLELADAVAADPDGLAAALATVTAPGDGPVLEAFLTEGHTRLDDEQLQRTLSTWTTGVVATLPVAAQLLLQALCRVEESDRSMAVLSGNWTGLWQRWGRSGAPPPLATCVAALLVTALITVDPLDDPEDPSGVVRYRVHRSVAEAVDAATPEPVTVAVDAQLAGWWAAVGDWGIEQEQAGTDTSQLVWRANLTAARYLLRQHQWNAASCLLERTLIRDRYAPATALAVLPCLRRIAEATGVLKDVVVLAAALRKVDPGEAETLLRRAYEQAATGGDHPLASTTAGDLVTLLRDQGRLREALTLAHQKMEHSSQAGFGSWTQLSDQGRRLQILSMLGHNEQVLLDLPTLRARMDDLPDQRAHNDRVNPWNVREGILDVGRTAAMALRRWEEALVLNGEIAGVTRRRGAGAHEMARTRFTDYTPLLRLGRLTDADRLLRDCQDVFDISGDVTLLAGVYSARAELEHSRDHPQDAIDLQRASLRLRYLRPDPGEIAKVHHGLATYLSGGSGPAAEQRAHRLAASLLHHLTGDTRELTRTIGVLAGELRTTTTTGLDGSGGVDAPGVPTTLPEVTRLVDAGEGVRFGALVVALCPDPGTAEHALADLVATAASAADLRAGLRVGTGHLVTAWEPIITAIGAAARNADTPSELTELLEEAATTDWAALVTALRRVLAGDRRREQLLAGLDDIGAAILTATFDRLVAGPEQES